MPRRRAGEVRRNDRRGYAVIEDSKRALDDMNGRTAEATCENGHNVEDSDHVTSRVIRTR
jgi:hypothetical protein